MCCDRSLIQIIVPFEMGKHFINLEQIEFYEDMKYTEDYFLTLQIFYQRRHRLEVIAGTKIRR